MFPWLTVLALLPLLGAAAMIVVKGTTAKYLGLTVSVLTLVLAVVLATQYQVGGGMQFVEDVVWIRQLGAHYALGLDGIGLTLVLLTTVLTPVVLLASWTEAERDKPGELNPPAKWSSAAFFGLVLCIEGLGIFAFTAIDVFLFYLFFEVILIPMYFLIGAFGGSRRAYAAGKFLLFGLGGGFIMLASVIGLYVYSAKAGTPSYLLSDLSQLQIPTEAGRWLFVGFMIAFAIKAPMVPFHSWMPDAAEQSTPGGAVMLAGVLDKIGTFGMIRFCLYLFPEASRWATPVVLTLAALSIVYGAVMAIGSKDLHRLIGWTSISHFGFIVLGIFAFTSQSMVGSTLYMLNHGLSTAALFLVVGFMIARRGSRRISDFGGISKVAPLLAGLMLFAGLSSMALPGLSSFVSEFMVVAGTFSRHPVYGSVAVFGIVLAALYILIMYQRTATGPVPPGVEQSVTTDLNRRERLALAPLVVLILVLGIFPRPFTAVIEPAVTAAMQHVGVTDPEPLVSAEGGR
jgi:NADH-quinone oxidoreductase subunit M